MICLYYIETQLYYQRLLTVYLNRLKYKSDNSGNQNEIRILLDWNFWRYNNQVISAI